MTDKDYTDEQAREAIAIVKGLTKSLVRWNTEDRRGEGIWDNLTLHQPPAGIGERILAFGKPPEPKRWPLTLDHLTSADYNGERVLIQQSTAAVHLYRTDMDRLFVAWAEERGIDLSHIHDIVEVWEMQHERSGPARGPLPQTDAIRAVLDNARKAAA